MAAQNCAAVIQVLKKKNSVGISALVLASEGKSVSARNVWSGQYQGEI